jgi:hypothetical protein
MDGDVFAERLACVRQRFCAKLAGRLGEIDAALPDLAGQGTAVAAAVYATHRKVHDLCGIGPTLGFDAIGTAARVCERILLEPSRRQRGLSEPELARLKEGLEALRAAAENDMQATATVLE